MTKRFSIKLKLILLAGVPVIGALILAALMARDAERKAASVASIGSIEDLAILSAQISDLVHELQFERNALALALAAQELSDAALREQFARSDNASQRVAAFMASREVSSLPPRLARDLKAARGRLDGLAALRARVREKQVELTELLDYYESTDHSLISATAALGQLSDDGELMRAIAALVGVLEIKERASQEHAVLSYVFTANTFPPGIYKELVTLLTEQADYIAALELNATDAVVKRFRAGQKGKSFDRAQELRTIALNALDEDFNVNPGEWSELQTTRIGELRALEVELNHALGSAASDKVIAAARGVRFAYGFGAGVVLVSALLAGLIARGISRSIGALAATAERVRVEQDFSVRAAKLSDDELGRLTDAFNEMLSGIQERDRELEEHRNNLQRLVEQRTLALQKRNEAMRLVLDNVDQGLVTIEPDGTLSSERSRVFDEWFGEASENVAFDEHIAKRDEHVRALLRFGWDQVADDFLPMEVALGQMPQRVELDGKHYALGYKAITNDADLQGVLLVVSDVTSEVARLRHEAEQREIISVFERVVDDRPGFFQFMAECDALVKSLLPLAGERRELMRALHTVKGNCATVGVVSVAELAHGLESAMVEEERVPTADELAQVTRAWESFSRRARHLTGAPDEPIVEVTAEEIDQLLALSAQRAPHAELFVRLDRLRDERVIVRLRRAGEQAKSIAKRLDKGDILVEIKSEPDLRVPPERFAPFWGAFVHVLRNAVDHGLERPAERVAAGKDARGRLTFSAGMTASGLVIELSDDGHGVNWERVRARARTHGLPHAEERDLVEALFADGLSTSEQVSSTSGRGVGLSAVRAAVRALGGSILILSKPGEGTTFRFTFPLSALNSPARSARPSGAARNSESAPKN